jgi:hypothetical protein
VAERFPRVLGLAGERGWKKEKKKEKALDGWKKARCAQ